MNRSIDMKSVLIGGLLVALFLCLVGAVPSANRDFYDRFKIATNDSHAFVLDSATGQVWSSIFISPEAGIGIGADPNFHAIKIFDGDAPLEY